MENQKSIKKDRNSALKRRAREHGPKYQRVHDFIEWNRIETNSANDKTTVDAKVSKKTNRCLPFIAILLYIHDILAMLCRIRAIKFWRTRDRWKKNIQTVDLFGFEKVFENWRCWSCDLLSNNIPNIWRNKEKAVVVFSFFISNQNV